MKADQAKLLKHLADKEMREAKFAVNDGEGFEGEGDKVKGLKRAPRKWCLFLLGGLVAGEPNAFLSA
jgi:hypothetical protein